MKKLLVPCFLLLTLQTAIAQNPLVKQWDYRFGGTGFDELTVFQETSEGGFIIGGSSSSGISGDKTQNSQGSYDYWIVKTDYFGNKQWDRDFGGTSSDRLYSLIQTNDNGFILAGSSFSNIGGDKTQALKGGEDYWIIKIDSIGNIEWDKDFGGTDDDYLLSIQNATDGGYMLGGYSNSGIGGDKTQVSFGGTDFWVIKIDSIGNKLWDKDFGGVNNDSLFCLSATSDGGYTLGGYSSSDISGNKTDTSFGQEDYWIVKIDSAGVKQWDKDYGGSLSDRLFSLKQTLDKGYVMAGISYSEISGNKTTPLWGGMYSDYWIIKTDSSGNKQWEKDFGGTNIEDEFGNVFLTIDEGYLFAGTSYSPISGDKTEANLGGEQSWIIKIDQLGNKLWDKTILTGGHDEIGYGIQTNDGCYAFANFTSAGVGGYKTQPNWGPINFIFDYWIVKFCDTTSIQANYAASNTAVCAGSCINYTNLSLGATSYQWNFPSATPNTSTIVNPQNICYDSSGSFNVILIASSGNRSDTLILNNYITVYPQSTPVITQNGNTLIVQQGYITYQWFFGSDSIIGANSYFYNVTQNGNYNIIVTDSNGCQVGYGILNVRIGIDEITFMNSVEVHPNPARDNINISLFNLQHSIFNIEIYNTLGEKIYSSEEKNVGGKYSKEISLKDFAEGIYVLQMKSAGGVVVKKFVVER